jgi:hypothetical protein
MRNFLDIRKMGRFLLKLILPILFALIFGEIIVRIFLPQPESITTWVQSDEKYGYTLKKNFYKKVSFPHSDFVMEIKTNSLGFRSKEYSLSEISNKNIKKHFY